MIEHPPRAAIHPLLRWIPVWRRNLLVWRKIAIASLLGHFGEPLLYLLGLGYGLGSIVGNIGELPYLVYLASGMVCSSAMMTATAESCYSAYSRMATQKNWSAIIATPLDVHDVAVGEIVWAASKSLLSACAILVVATLLGAVHGSYALLAVPVALLTGLCFASMGLLVTSISRGFEYFLYYTTLVVTPMFMLSGVFFPISRLPDWLQWVSQFMPLTHAVNLARPLIIGANVTDIWSHIGVLLAYIVIAAGLAINLLRRRLLV